MITLPRALDWRMDDEEEPDTTPDIPEPEGPEIKEPEGNRTLSGLVN
jgi:hypothetical protein